jgi:hypothetical protein
MKIKLLILSTIFIPILLSANGDKIPYFSPGLRIGWNFKKVITLDAKISLGIAGIGPGFCNVTAGARSAMVNFSHSGFDLFYHVDVQMGGGGNSLFDRNSSLIYGGGLGIGFDKDGTFPCISIFSGMLLFTTVDMFYSKFRGFNTDLGFQGVLPIPLIKLDFGSIGG